MKHFTFLILVLISVQVSFAQRDSAMLANWYSQDTATYNRLIKPFNEKYGIELCDCTKNNPTIYMYRMPSMRTIKDSTGKEYLMHQIYILEQTLQSWQTTVYENFVMRTTAPKSGWRAFNQVLDSIDVPTLPKHFFEIEYTVIASPDGMMNMLRTCENGAPKVYILLGGLEFVFQSGMDMNAYRLSGQQVWRVRRLLSLFTLEFAP